MAQGDQGKAAESSQRETHDLNDAVQACFAPDVLTPPFPTRLVELTAALTNSPRVSIWIEGKNGTGPECLAQRGQAAAAAALEQKISEALERTENPQAHVAFSDGFLFALVALPAGQIAVLAVAAPAGGPAAQGLAYERVSLLANLAFSQFRNPDQMAQSALAKSLRAVAAGQTDQLQVLADRLAALTSAEYAAVGLWQGGTIGPIKISGQTDFAKRASLPASMRERLTETARQQLAGKDRVFARAQGREDGLVMLLEQPRRANAALDLAAAIWGQCQHAAPPRRWSQKRLVKMGAFGLILVGLGLIPIPDGASVPSTVEAQNRRILSAPFTTTLSQITVDDGLSVAKGDTLLRLDTKELDLELVGLQSERASAIIERETARASNNAAALRNAEISVERLDARIALLQSRKETAQMSAPISGVIVLNELEQSIGTTVRQGDALLEIVDPTSLALSIALPETDIGKLQTGDSGKFRPDFDPTLSIGATIQNISPAIDMSAEIPLAHARARFDEPTEDLRPGVKGVFQSSDQFTPIWLVLYKNLRDWALLRFLI